MCVADVYVTDSASDTELTAESQARADDAVDWIYDMMQIIRPLLGNVNNAGTVYSDTANINIQGSVTPTPDYDSTFTGPVSGTFDISALNPVVGGTFLIWWLQVRRYHSLIHIEVW